jgi:regulator of protease activity HflC (stomatin/prohibitin superfamily)
MSDRLAELAEFLRNLLTRMTRWLTRTGAEGAHNAVACITRRRVQIIAMASLALVGSLLWRHPPVETVPRGEVVVRNNVLTGRVSQFGEGSLWVLPGLHEVRRFPIRDQVYRPTKSSKANGEAPFQSLEGLSLGVDLAVRFAIDPNRITLFAKTLPDDITGQVVEPAVESVIYQLFAHYTVREIFSSKRAEIQETIESQLRPKLGADGIVLRSVQMGQVDLPQDYRNGLDKLLAEELESEKMRFTLELKDKRVRATELEGDADKARREKAAEAAAAEQVIAAKGQEEAMKHVLPFKQKQVEQRRLEAEADKVARIRAAEGTAEARRIEAGGEADSRQKLADAEVYRLERVGKVNADQMQREGELISQNPLLIQKTLADKLSDKVQVIIAPPPANGGFIGSTLLGGAK